MYILSVTVREFGGLRDVTLDFSKGLNLVTGNNESGKSTLIAFIRFILYGLPKRRAGEALSDGDRAYSWENGVADGSMTVEKNGTVYRIERREMSGSSRKLLQIIDVQSGQTLPKGETPEHLLLGFPVEVFDSTACIRQLRAGEIDGTGLSSAIENLLLAGDESISTEKVLKALERARTVLRHKSGNGGETYRVECELSALYARLDRIRADADALRETELRKDALRARIAEAERELERSETSCRLLADAEILARFDALHKEEERLDRMKKTAESTVERHTRNGFLPEGDFVRTLEDHADRLDADERSLLRCDAEHRIAAEAPAPDKALLASAVRIRETGGKGAILDRLTNYDREIRKKSRLAGVLLAVGGAALLAGILLAVLLSPVLALVSVGAFLAPVGGVLLSKKKRTEAARTALYALCGAPSGASLSDLSAAIDRSLAAEKRESERVLRLSDAKRALDTAEARKTAHEREAERDASRVLCDSGSVTASLLRETARSLSDEIAERARNSHAVAVSTENYRRMASALSGFDEAAIRARLPQGTTAGHETAADAEARRSRARAACAALEAERLEVERRLSALEATVGSPEELLAEIEEKTAEKARLYDKHRAVLLAIESISAAREGLKSRIGPKLRADAAVYLSTLSDGRYDALSLDSDFSLSTEENGIVHPSDAFSGGTRDAMYLSLRLALTGLLSGAGEPIPILLDEALAQLDDTRAKALLGILLSRAASGGQSIFFTCHSREGAMLRGSDAAQLRLGAHTDSE